MGYVTDLQRKSHISPWEQRYSQNKHAQCGFGLTDNNRQVLETLIHEEYGQMVFSILAFIYIIRKTISLKKKKLNYYICRYVYYLNII